MAMINTDNDALSTLCPYERKHKPTSGGTPDRDGVVYLAPGRDTHSHFGNDANITTVPVEIDRELHTAVKQLAYEQRISMSNIIGQALSEIDAELSGMPEDQYAKYLATYGIPSRFSGQKSSLLLPPELMQSIRRKAIVGRVTVRSIVYAAYVKLIH